MVKAQSNQKGWYDRVARIREFDAEDKVLVLLPTAHNKLQAEWKGPFPVMRKASPVVIKHCQ